MNTGGSNLEAFPTGLTQSWEPAWSPDGRNLLFSQSPATIYAAELSGANRT